MEKHPNVSSLTIKNGRSSQERPEIKNLLFQTLLNPDKLRMESQDLLRVLEEKDDEIESLREENKRLLEQIKKKDSDLNKLNSLLGKMKDLEKDNIFLKKRLQMLVQTSQHLQGESVLKNQIFRSDSADCYRKVDISSSKTRENSNLSPASQDSEIEKRIEALRKGADSLLNSPLLKKNNGVYKEKIMQKDNQSLRMVNSVQPVKKQLGFFNN
jgi:chromosome segregation ATPase